MGRTLQTVVLRAPRHLIFMAIGLIHVAGRSWYRAAGVHELGTAGPGNLWIDTQD